MLSILSVLSIARTEEASAMGGDPRCAIRAIRAILPGLAVAAVLCGGSIAAN
jgi:hypothetical protein